MKTSPGSEFKLLMFCLAAPGVRATRSQKTHQKSNPFSTSPSSLNDAQAEIEAEPEIEAEVQIEAEAETAIEMTDAEGSEADTSYIERERDFFKAGLLFKVAKEGDPLHLNQYILLDKNYNDGPCLQVFTYDGGNPMLGEANFLRSHVEIQTHDSKPPEDDGSEDSGKRRRIVYLDEYSAAEENTYVKLAWTANISFEGYRYKDCGELDRRYLRELRSSYADWLKYYWDLD